MSGLPLVIEVRMVHGVASRAWCSVMVLVIAMCFARGALAQPAIDHEQALAVFNDAKGVSDRDGARLWGHELYGPMVLVDRKTRYAVANQPDDGGALKASGGVYAGTLPDEVIAANTASRWGGKHWTMLLWPLPERRVDRQLLLAHEMFHRIQDDMGLPASSPPNSHLDSYDGRVWLRLEWRALGDALILDGEARVDAVRDAMAFRAVRRTFFAARAAEENALEMNEGIAEYTGFRLCGLPEGATAYRARAQLERYEEQSSYVRSFAYASGPAYGLLLDASGVEWRKSLTAQSDLGPILMKAFDIEPIADPRAHAEGAIDRYDARPMIAREQRRDSARKEQNAKDRARFVDGPVLILPAGAEFNYGFNPNAMRPLDEHATVFSTLTVTDAWGKLDAQDDALMVRNKDGSTLEVRVVAPAQAAGPELSGAGWKLRLNDGWGVMPGPRAGDFTVTKK